MPNAPEHTHGCAARERTTNKGDRIDPTTSHSRETNSHATLLRAHPLRRWTSSAESEGSEEGGSKPELHSKRTSRRQGEAVDRRFSEGAHSLIPATGTVLVEQLVRVGAPRLVKANLRDEDGDRDKRGHNNAKDKANADDLAISGQWRVGLAALERSAGARCRTGLNAPAGNAPR